VDVGQTVAASLAAPTLFIIANDLSKMQVHASVDEADIGSISQAADVSFTVDAYPNRIFRGSISEIRLEPQTVQNVVTYNVIIDVNNERLELKPGMTANIAITVADQRDVLKIPNTALRYLPPGVTREQVSQMIREAQGAKAPTGVGAMPSARTGEAGSAAERGQRGAWPGPSGSKSAAAPEQVAADGMAAAEEALAPGQMWDPSAKIQFPHQEGRPERPAIVWLLGRNNKPEARHVVVGITDGTWTQLISGDLKEGDAVIVGDNIQVASTASQPGGGFGGGPRLFGGPR
jgi:HlyD family secretion protein